MKTLINKKTGAGHYEITVMENHFELGKFETTDMDLVSLIDEYRQFGSIDENDKFENFEEMYEYCKNKIN